MTAEDLDPQMRKTPSPALPAGEGGGEGSSAVKWPLVPLGEALTHRKEFVRIDDTRTYKRCRVRLHAQGIVLRDRVEGALIKTKQQQVCRAGELLVAEIDAKVGGYGIVPAELEGAIVSSHYFLFAVDQRKLDERFLGYWIKTPFFRDQISARGSTNYAAIRPHHVLDYLIPLPPLPEQRRIVAKIERLAAKIDEARRLRRSADEEVRSVLQSARRTLIGESASQKWVQLGSVVADIRNGWSPACQSHRATDGRWGVIKVSAVSFGVFDPLQNKELPEILEPKLEYQIKAGDFLMSRANTRELVGTCALVKHTPIRLLLCDKVFRFTFSGDSALSPEFLDHVLKSPALRKQIEAVATGTSPTMKNISKEKIVRLLIPLPAVEQQSAIVTRLEALETLKNHLKVFQGQTAAELDALLPAVLDKAFRGEL